jgi:hypothetical protein
MEAMERSHHAALQHEHSLLLRQLAGLQRRVSGQLGACASRLTALDGEVLRLRAQLMVARTGILWGLGTESLAWTAGPRARAHRPVPGQTAMNAAQAVICRTGCVGHAHPWLAADGQCLRSGQACERSALSSPAD